MLVFGALCKIFKIQLNFFSKSFAAYVFHASVVYYVIGAFFFNSGRSSHRIWEQNVYRIVEIIDSAVVPKSKAI